MPLVNIVHDDVQCGQEGFEIEQQFPEVDKTS